MCHLELKTFPFTSLADVAASELPLQVRRCLQPAFCFCSSCSQVAGKGAGVSAELSNCEIVQIAPTGAFSHTPPDGRGCTTSHLQPPRHHSLPGRDESPASSLVPGSWEIKRVWKLFSRAWELPSTMLWRCVLAAAGNGDKWMKGRGSNTGEQ